MPKLNFSANQKLLDLCLDNNIPIIRDNTALYIFNTLIDRKTKSMLEIGTAYGYSCSLWNQSIYLKELVSIEKNENNYKLAKQYLTDKKIKLICADAFNYLPKKKFDVIFLDGPKSHQIELINHYLPFLKRNGLMFIDNLFLKKITNLPPDQLTKNQKHLLDKINELNYYLKTQTLFNFSLINIDDGLGIIWKK